MQIDELLIRIGVDTSQAAKIKSVITSVGAAATRIAGEADRINKTLDSVGGQSIKSTEEATNKAEATGIAINKVKLLAVGAAAAIGYVYAKAVGFIDGALSNAGALSTEKGLLYDISARELKQADEYQAAMKRTGLLIDSVRTKIALNLAPALTQVASGFNRWLTSNKDLVTRGLTQVIACGTKVLQVLIHSAQAINRLITCTLGWKMALLALTGVLAVLRRSMIMAFIVNPLAWVVAALVGLMLLLDDLMVYLEGGESLFGDFWKPAITGIKAVIAWLNRFCQQNKMIVDSIAAICRQRFNAMMSIVSLWINAVRGAFALIAGLFTGKTSMMGDLWHDMVARLIRVWHGLEPHIDAFFLAFGILWGQITEAASRAFNAMPEGVSGFLTRLGDVLSGAGDIIKKPFAGALDWVLQKYEQTIGTIKGMWQEIKGFFSSGDDGGMQIADGVMSTLSAGNGESVGQSVVNSTASHSSATTTITQGDITVNQSIQTSDPKAAGKMAADGVGQQLRQASQNLAGVYG